MAASAEFISLCRQIASKAVLADLPYEVLESRCRAATISVLLPARTYSPDEIADFYRVHYAEVDQVWRSAIEDMMKTVDTDRRGTLEKVLGIPIPQSSHA
jgi:hypothetical protein